MPHQSARSDHAECRAIKHLTWLCASLWALVLASCGEVTDAPNDPACGVALERSAARPGTPVGLRVAADHPLDGMTFSFLEPIRSEAVDAAPLLLHDAATGATALAAPFHPTDLEGGGPIRFALATGGATCAFDFTVSSLPDHADAGVAGSAGRLLAVLQAGLDDLVLEAGYASSVLRGPLDEVPGALLPFAVAQFLLDHPDNSSSLARLLETGSIEIEGERSTLDTVFLDRLLAGVGDDLAAGETSRLAGRLALACPIGTDAFSPVVMADASDLWRCLHMQRRAEGRTGYVDLASRLASMMTATMLLTPEAFSSLLAMPMAFVSLQFAVASAQAHGLATLLPRGVRTGFDVSADALYIGEEASWHSVTLTPIGSRAFSVDRFAADLIFGAISILGPAQQEVLHRILSFLIEETAKGVADRLGFVEIGPYTWPAIPVADEDANTWAFASHRGDAIRVTDQTNRTFRGHVEGSGRLEVIPGQLLREASTMNSVNGERTIEVVPWVIEVTFEHRQRDQTTWDDNPPWRLREYSYRATVRIPPNPGIPDFNPNLSRGSAPVEIVLHDVADRCDFGERRDMVLVKRAFEAIPHEPRLTALFDTQRAALLLMLDDSTFRFSYEATCRYPCTSRSCDAPYWETTMRGEHQVWALDMRDRNPDDPTRPMCCTIIDIDRWDSVEDGVYRVELEGYWFSAGDSLHRYRSEVTLNVTMERRPSW